MRLVSYAREGAWRAGVLCGERVVDAAECAQRAGLGEASGGWTTVRQAIAQPGERLARLTEASACEAGEHGMELADVRLGPPVPDPTKILCIGLNYADHAAEAGMAIPEHPVVFAKFPNALIAAGDPIELPAVSEEVDYEGELAVVIGRRCKDVAEADALDAVAGYMPFNDVSARDIQLRTSQWISGKALDTSGPSGPALVLRDEVPDPQALRIVTTLNGEVLQESSTDQMIFPVRRLVAYISALMTLEPGDVIATGTPAGVGFKRTPPIYLRAGDTVQVAIDGLGTLENPVVAPRAAGTLAAGTGVSA